MFIFFLIFSRRSIWTLTDQAIPWNSPSSSLFFYNYRKTVLIHLLLVLPFKTNILRNEGISIESLRNNNLDTFLKFVFVNKMQNVWLSIITVMWIKHNASNENELLKKLNEKWTQKSPSSKLMDMYISVSLQLEGINSTYKTFPNQKILV